MMASVLYVPHREEFPNGWFPLPWDDAGEPAIVGQFAREHGALVPDRLVTSAQSWLSNPHIDPKQRILPWRSDIAEEKLSPLECSRRYLAPQGRVSTCRACAGTGLGLLRGPDRLDRSCLVDEVAEASPPRPRRPRAWGTSHCWRSHRRHSTPGRRRRAEHGASWSLPAISSLSVTSVAGQPTLA